MIRFLVGVVVGAVGAIVLFSSFLECWRQEEFLEIEDTDELDQPIGI
jgi:hypothetical protein